jgi:hypothetical protein
MSSLAMKWRYEQEDAWRREQLRLAAERGPLPRNEPELLKPVRIRVLKAFYVRGRPLAVGEVATVEAHVARDAVALKRAEYAG